jgi:hypothetical protein
VLHGTVASASRKWVIFGTSRLFTQLPGGLPLCPSNE